MHSNCDEVELLVNGKSAGRKPVVKNKHVDWSVPYAPGSIVAIGYQAGKKMASAERKTAGQAHAIRLTADRRRIRADGRDLAMITAQVVDKAGNVVPEADALVRFDVAGSGQVIGVGNGNPTSLEADQASQRQAFNGLCQAIVQSRGGSGTVKVSGSSAGLIAGTVVVVALP